MFKDLIQLQNANMYQETKSGNKSEWIVRENITGEVLQKFSKNLSDNDMFSIIEFARKFELIAFNAGISFNKKQYKKGFK